MTCNIIVPVKCFNKGKTRLSDAMDLTQRAQLSRLLLKNTLDVIKRVKVPVHPVVVSHDPLALEMATLAGFGAIDDLGYDDLNLAIMKATREIKDGNPGMVMILPADLPLLTEMDIEQVISEGRQAPVAVIVPDRREQGTNCLLLNPPDLIGASFGEGSYKRHKELVNLAQGDVKIIHNENLSIDLDLPEDLQFLTGREHSRSGIVDLLNQLDKKKRGIMFDRVALYLQDAHDLRDGLDYVRYAEAKGFEAVWQAESRLVRDAIVPMAAYAAVTDKIKVGSGVINNWTRNIGLLASTFLTLDDLAPNRIICGIGAWWDPLAKNVGIDRTKPLKAMEETITVLKRLLNMENVTFEGEFVHVKGIELDVVHGRREPRHVPVYIGATGEKMMEMAGRIADGVVMNYCVPVEYNDTSIEMLHNGLKQSGRTLEEFDRPQLVVCSVDEDHDVAIDTTRELLTQYLAQQPHIAKASGVSKDVVEKIQSILGWPATHEQIQKAKHLVPEELIHSITASGTPGEARAKVQEYIDHGCTCPILYPVGGNVKLLIDTFSS